jgi:hypothetical protein
VFRNHACALSLVLLTGLACSVLSEMDAHGSYVSNIEVGTETLEVRSDGTYSHRYILNGADQITNDGIWKHHNYSDRFGGDIRIILSDYEFVASAKYGFTAHKNDEFSAELFRCGFEICIGIKSEPFYAFRKLQD